MLQLFSLSPVFFFSSSPIIVIVVVVIFVIVVVVVIVWPSITNRFYFLTFWIYVFFRLTLYPPLSQCPVGQFFGFIWQLWSIEAHINDKMCVEKFQHQRCSVVTYFSLSFSPSISLSLWLFFICSFNLAASKYSLCPFSFNSLLVPIPCYNILLITWNSAYAIKLFWIHSQISMGIWNSCWCVWIWPFYWWILLNIPIFMSIICRSYR